MIDRSLPLCELHRHLDGSIRLETILDLADQHGIALPARDVTGLAPYIHIDESAPGLMATKDSISQDFLKAERLILGSEKRAPRFFMMSMSNLFRLDMLLLKKIRLLCRRP